MSFKYSYCKLLIFYISLTLATQDISAKSNYDEVQDNSIIGVPNIPPKQHPKKREGKNNLVQIPASILPCNTTDVDLSNRVLVKVGPDDFKSCPTVKKINLSRNLLKTLPTNVFESNRILQVLDLSDNSFQELNPLWFTPFAKSLEELDVSRNLLKVFSVSLFPEMNHLKHLSLAENHLLDIDENGVVKKFPTLNRFEFTFNYIGCNRSEELQEYFKSKKVVTAFSRIYKGSKEAVFPQTEKGCINDEELASMKLKLNNKDANYLVPFLIAATFAIIFFIGGLLIFIRWKRKQSLLNHE